jgi:hypothetical protein
MYNGIAQNIINDPGSYSIEMLTAGVENGTVPAYIGIPLIQQKTQELNKSKLFLLFLKLTIFFYFFLCFDQEYH